MIPHEQVTALEDEVNKGTRLWSRPIRTKALPQEKRRAHNGACRRIEREHRMPVDEAIRFGAQSAHAIDDYLQQVKATAWREATQLESLVDLVVHSN